MALRRPTSARVKPDAVVAEEVRAQMRDQPHNAVQVRATLARHPGLAKAIGGLADQVLNRAAVPRRQRELVILRMGWNCQARYEFGQHTLLGLAHGVAEEEIAAVTPAPALLPLGRRGPGAPADDR
jgi:4-carboxymuconolactone decarboxylase